MRIVIDTNSLVAARFKPHGLSARLLHCCISGLVEATISKEIERENRRIVGRVKPPAWFLNTLESYFTSAAVVDEPPTIRACEDPDDDKYLACAVGERAEYIITSDRHLLQLNGYSDLQICSSGTFFLHHPELKSST